MLPENPPQAIGDLSERRLGQDRLDEDGDHIASRAGALLDSVEGGTEGGVGSSITKRPDALHLLVLHLGIDPEDVRGRVASRIHETVHAHDGPLARLDILL